MIISFDTPVFPVGIIIGQDKILNILLLFNSMICESDNYKTRFLWEEFYGPSTGNVHSKLLPYTRALAIIKPV